MSEDNLGHVIRLKRVDPRQDGEGWEDCARRLFTVSLSQQILLGEHEKATQRRPRMDEGMILTIYLTPDRHGGVPTITGASFKEDPWLARNEARKGRRGLGHPRRPIPSGG